jgi:hypothetical protein
MQPREIRQAVRSWIPAVTHGDRSPLLVYDRCESTMLRCLLCLIAIPSLLAAQESPKVREAPGPTTSARIRVSCRVQQAYVGPAQQWFNSGVDSLSDEQITDLERVLSTDAEDICARGYLIAHGQDRALRRMEHVLWMIENHPAWDGFALNLSLPRYANEQVAYDNIRTAWLQQARADQKSGTVLHHAAVFFGWREPDYAEALLKRAINLEPEVEFHVQGLGILYGSAQFSPRNPSFAARAKSILLSSSDPLIVAGALNEIGTLRGGDFVKSLSARLSEVAGKQNAEDILRDLRFRSARSISSQCIPLPLLRRCVDR